MRSTPPPLASKLLEVSNADPALVGDLTEEWGQGRSTAWYWKQVLNIAARQFFQDRIFATRWLLTLPAAILAAGLVPEILLLLSNTALLRQASSLSMMLLSAFLMSAVFVRVAVSMVPSRKADVARIAFMVVAGFGALFIAGLANPGHSVRDVRTLSGVCLLLGGMIGRMRTRALLRF